jgi:hypothetical protein
MRQQQQQSVTPSAIAKFAAAEQTTLDSLAAAVTTVNQGVLALDALIAQLQNSPGILSPADQTLLDQIQTQSQALVSQVQAINTTPPGTPIPVTPPAPITPAP